MSAFSNESDFQVMYDDVSVTCSMKIVSTVLFIFIKAYAALCFSFGLSGLSKPLQFS